MPFPITVGGKQYATAGPDYCYGINVNASDDNKAAAMVFVKWMVEESGWCDLEGGYPISKTAPTSFVFDGVDVVNNLVSLPGEEDLMNQMNAESELSFNGMVTQRFRESSRRHSQAQRPMTTSWQTGRQHGTQHRRHAASRFCTKKQVFPKRKRYKQR